MTAHRPAAGAHVLVVQPDPLGRLFQLTSCLRYEQVGLEHVRPYDDGRVPARLEADGLVVLGGHMSSLDDAEIPWLEGIRALQRDAATQGKPSLGICLGGQLMAQAFGGTTAIGEAGLETGTVEVDWLPAAADDPLVGGLNGPHVAGTMHGDTVTTLPASAVWLGTGSPYPHQVFRVGRTSWGIQFHPELDRAGYQLWMDAHEDPTSEDLERLQAGGKALEGVEDAVLRGNRALLRSFLRLLRPQPQRAPQERPR